MTSNNNPLRSGARQIQASLLALALTASLSAQQTPPPANQTPPPANEATPPEKVVVLTPFEVTTERDQGYFSENTLAGSRMRTNVADLASSITVINAQQLEDTASLDINDIFRYEANTEGSNTYTPAQQALRNDGIVDVNSGVSVGGGAAQTNSSANRVRGIGIPSTTTNFYTSISRVPFDAYNVQSIEISRGPNSMLFGMGSPAGIVNQTNAQAVLDRNSASTSFRTDNYGSRRVSVSFNKSLIEGKLAIYGAYLNDNKQFERKPSFDNTERAFGAFTIKPFQKTVIRGSFERFNNHSRRPNTLTPRDAVSEWREAGSPAFDPTTGRIIKTATGEVIGPLALRAGSPRIAETRAWIESRPNFNAALWNADRTQYNGVAIFGGAALTNTNSILYTPGLQLSTTSRPIAQIADGQVQNYFLGEATRFRQTFGTPTNPAANAPLFPVNDAAIFANPANALAYDTTWTQSTTFREIGNGIGSFNTPGVTNKSIYDWEDINVLQANFSRSRDNQYNIELEQQILPNLSLSAGWFRQEFKAVDNLTVAQLNATTLRVDTNLRMPNGEINPLFGQTYVEDFDPDQGVSGEKQETFRGMLAWTPDFTRNENWTKWLGSHQILGLAQRETSMRSTIRRRMFVTSSDEAANGTILFTNNPNNNADGSPSGFSNANRSIIRRYYLGAPGTQPYGTVNKPVGNFDGANGFAGQLTFFNFGTEQWEQLAFEQSFIDFEPSTGRNKRTIDSYSGGITSRLWNDRLVTTFGVRRDEFTAKSTTTGALFDSIGGNQIAPALTNPEKFVNGEFQTDLVFNRFQASESISGTTTTKGGVLRPFSNWRSIDEKANGGSVFYQFVNSLGFSYNRSDNFNAPPAVQVDGFGNPLPKPTGNGKDYGVQFALFENKLFFRLNWFKATNENERIAGGTTMSRLTSNIDEGQFRVWAQTIALINMGFDPRDTTTFNVNLSPAQIEQRDAATAQIWGLPFTYYGDIGTIAGTRTAKAKGKELQITYNPTRNWTMKFTGGQQNTITDSNLDEFDAWFAVRNAAFSSARAADFLLPQFQNLATFTTTGGTNVDLRSFLGGFGFTSQVRDTDQNGNTTVQGHIDNILTPQVLITKALEGQNAPGQRKYRWSYLTNYSIKEGMLKGFSMGGSVRWEDSAIIGYFGKVNEATTSTDLTLADTTRPIRDNAQYFTDLWVGYTRDIFRDSVRMKIQLNVNDVFENGGLQTVGVNFDGSPSAFRIVDSRQFVISTKFDF